MYYVWKRSDDGWIDSSAGGMPRNYQKANGELVEFELLATMDAWNCEEIIRLREVHKHKEVIK